MDVWFVHDLPPGVAHDKKSDAALKCIFNQNNYLQRNDFIMINHN